MKTIEEQNMENLANQGLWERALVCNEITKEFTPFRVHMKRAGIVCGILLLLGISGAIAYSLGIINF